MPGGMGLCNYSVTDVTGPVAAINIVSDGIDIMLIFGDGIVIRMDTALISILGRATRGVRLMRVPEGSRVMSTAITPSEADAI